MNKHKRWLAIMGIFIMLFSNMNLTVLSAVEAEEGSDPTAGVIDISSDWQGSVMGNVGGQNKITSENFGITENEDGTVTMMSSNNRGKIESGSEGIAYYFKDVPADANYEFSATAQVDSWDPNNQVGFGIMLRSNVLDNEDNGSFTGDYIAAGNIRQEMRGFYKVADQDFTYPDNLAFGGMPVVGESYDISIRKSGDLYTIKLGDKEQTVDDFTGEINYAGLFTSRNTTVTFRDVNLKIEGQIELGEWGFDVFGSNTGDDKNPDPTVNGDDSVTLEATGGKISSSVDGISFYHKEIPADANFEIKTKASVDRFEGGDSQVSFGLMLRDELGEHRSSDGHVSNYVSVGALDSEMKGFYKQGSRQKLDAFVSNNVPAANEVYDLTIKKSGNTYVVSSNGEESDPISLDNIFTDSIYAGFYVARGATVTFSEFDITVDTRNVSQLNADTSGMKTEYLVGESLDLSGLEIQALFDDGTSEVLSSSDYIVTGFDSNQAGTNTITINYNGVTTTVDVEIVPLTVTDMQIKYYPAKTVYYKGDTFDPQGIVVVAEYNDGYTTNELTNDQYTLSISGETISEEGFQFESSGTKTVQVTSTETSDQRTTFDVEVKDADITGLEIKQDPVKTIYFLGDELDLAGISVYATYSDGSEVRLTSDDYEVTELDSSTAGEKVVTLTHKGERVDLAITVKERELTGIEVVSYPKTTFSVGDDFVHDGLEVAKVYDNEDREELVDFTIDSSDFDNASVGKYAIKIVPDNGEISPIVYQVSVRKALEPEWNTIRFGQSTSEDSNTIKVNEDGTVEIAAIGGAGKITGDHDGISYYYTEIDADNDNFVLSANIKVIEYAKDPHDGQESFGIMARDAIGTNGDSGVFASNIAAIGGYSGGTRDENGTQLFVRTGVLASDGEGSQGIQKKMIKNEKPTAATTHPNEEYKLTLAKTNSGFTGKLNNGQEEIIYEPEILNVQNGKMYVGFYTARVATIEVSDINLTVTDTATDAPRVIPPADPVSPNFSILSLDKVSKTDYTLLTQANVDGTLTVKEGNEIIADNAEVTAGEIVEIPTTIAANEDTNFSLTFLPDDTQKLTDYSEMVRNFTVTMKTYEAEDGNIYVSPTGSTNGDGTREKPLDLDTAIEFVQEGQKIIVQEGQYVRDSMLEIKKYNDGTEEARKYLVADPDAEERPLIDFDKKSAGVVHSGNYWHVEGIDFARSAGNTTGYRIGGDHNIIEDVKTYEHGDTGLQISRTDQADEIADWPSYNLILNSESFDNRDPSDNNADGFAAKLTTGVGNVFRGTVAHNNIDDGWDLYTKVGSGAIGAVTIEDSIAYNNGFLSDGTVGSGDKNGFKLGGEGVHVPHEIKNSVAFGNGAYGFASNSNPGVIAENNFAFNNEKANLDFTTYGDIKTDFTIDGFISFHTEANQPKDNYPTERNADINFMYNGTTTQNKSGEKVPSDLIEILKTVESVERDQDNNLLWEEIWDAFYAFVDSYRITTPDTDETEAPEENEDDQAGTPGEKDDNGSKSPEETGNNEAETPEEPGDDQSDASKKGENEDQEGSELPATSTGIYNMMLLGFVLASVGGLLFMRKIRKERNVN